MAGMTTVLHIITGLGSGGAERMMTRIATSSGEVRHVVVSLVDGGFFDRDLTFAGVEYHCLKLNRIWDTPRAFLELTGLIRKFRPDTVMTWLYHADFLGTLAAITCRLGTRKVIWNLRCSVLDFHDYAISTRCLAYLLAHLSPYPGAVTYNSHRGREAHERLGYRPRRWVYTPNGFDTDKWHPDEIDRRAVRAEWKIADDQMVVAMIARYSPQKDFPTFFAAANETMTVCPKAHFVLIGRGTENLNIPIPLRGHLSALGERQDIPRLLRGIDILVLSSRYGEGFSNAIGEAMATGIPCVSTDAGDAALVIGNTGRIVPTRSPKLLAEAICDLAALSSEARTELGAAARRRIVDNWSMERILANYADLWTDIATTG
jgi:glycosyltransferase involved in cell wall biosynthesis